MNTVAVRLWAHQAGFWNADLSMSPVSSPRPVNRGQWLRIARVDRNPLAQNSLRPCLSNGHGLYLGADAAGV